eukprot:8088524-Karenia_brevis.AAC.1
MGLEGVEMSNLRVSSQATSQETRSFTKEHEVQSAAPNKKPINVARAFASVWVKHDGMPQLLVRDQG